MVSVVPDARLLASLTDGQSSNSVLALFSTDGTGRRAIPGTAATSGDRGPSWAPDGEHFVFHLGGRLMFGDTLGAITRAIPDAAGLNEELWGEYTHDGQLVYFGGRTGTQNAEIWRVHSDGTNAERAGPAAGFYDVDYQPSPSPDGARVVFETNRAGAALGMLDTSTGAVTYLQVPAIRARWSPVGDTIAVLDAGIVKLIHADGSIIRIVGNPAGGYAGTMSWSPDGRWLVINRAGLVELIDTRGGAGIPLPQSAGYSEAAWRPDR
jgi:Tol biopolymer transport system component